MTPDKRAYIAYLSRHAKAYELRGQHNIAAWLNALIEQVGERA